MSPAHAQPHTHESFCYEEATKTPSKAHENAKRPESIMVLCVAGNQSHELLYLSHQAL